MLEYTGGNNIKCVLGFHNENTILTTQKWLIAYFQPWNYFKFSQHFADEGKISFKALLYRHYFSPQLKQKTKNNSFPFIARQIDSIFCSFSQLKKRKNEWYRMVCCRSDITTTLFCMYHRVRLGLLFLLFFYWYQHYF